MLHRRSGVISLDDYTPHRHGIALTSVLRTPPPQEQHLERVSELSAHGAVDEEVQRIAQKNEEIDEQRGGVGRIVCQYGDVGDVLDDDQDVEDGQREFDEQEEADDDDEHHGRTVALRQAAGFRLFILPQQLLPAHTGDVHGVHEQGVQDGGRESD